MIQLVGRERQADCKPESDSVGILGSQVSEIADRSFKSKGYRRKMRLLLSKDMSGTWNQRGRDKGLYSCILVSVSVLSQKLS